MRIFKALGLMMALYPSVGHACGTESDCMLSDGRHYRIALPDGDVSGALLFAHGYGGTARQSIANKALLKMAADLGIALIAVKSSAKDWSIANAPGPVTAQGVDEVLYIDRVMEDVQARFGVQSKDVVVSGFSAGAMLAWTVACDRGAEFGGYVPISGVFWSPIPQECQADAGSVIHIHGDRDKTVPLAGRPVMNTHQGDVNEVLSMYRHHGQFSIAGKARDDGMQCQVSLNSKRQRLEFCMFEGGHELRVDLLKAAYLRLLSAAGDG